MLREDLSKSQYDWLPRDLKKGETVFEFIGVTYGAISKTGTPILLERETYPFLEVPRTAVMWADH